MENEMEQRVAMLEKQIDAMISRYNHIATDYDLLRLQVKNLMKDKPIDSRLDYLGRI